MNRKRSYLDTYKGDEYLIYHDLWYLNVPPTWGDLDLRSEYDVLTIYHDIHLEKVETEN